MRQYFYCLIMGSYCLVFWAYGKNGWVPYGQKGIDGGSKWRPRFGWVDDVKVALGNRGMKVEAARQCAKIGKSGEPWFISNWMSFMQLSWLCVLSESPPMPWWLSPGEGRDAVTWCGWYKLEICVNYWKSRRKCQVYGLRGVCSMIMSVIWLDITTPSWWRKKVVVYYYNNNSNPEVCRSSSQRLTLLLLPMHVAFQPE